MNFFRTLNNKIKTIIFICLFIILTAGLYVLNDYFETKKLTRDFSRSLPTMEAAPVVLNEKLLVITFERGGSESFGRNIVIYDGKSYQEIARIPWDKGLGSAIVVDNELYVFGSSDWSKYSNCIFKAHVILEKKPRIASEDKIYCAENNNRIFNTSVAKTDSGYVVAYEEDENKSNIFYTSFLESNSLKSFKKLSTNFRKGTYTACPTIRFSEGYYHLFFLDRDSSVSGFPIYSTKMVFAKKLNELVPNTSVLVLDPFDGLSVNNSDMDFMEFAGKTYLFFSESDQRTWAKVYRANYNASESKFLSDLRNLRGQDFGN